jgi:uncharacterized protein YdhG (YjbR/CyaY superfamily)
MSEYADYIEAQDEPARSTLDRFLKRALVVEPTAEEGTSYGMAALRYRGRPLISVVATKAGYSVYPFSPEVVELVLPTLEGFDSTKGGIRFSENQMLPDTEFDALVTARVAEIDAALDRGHA